METAEKIIEGIEKDFPKTSPTVIKNCLDTDINRRENFYFQYILGLTQHDKYGSGIAHYERRMIKQVGINSRNIQCWPQPFEEDEIEEAKKVFTALADYYEIVVDTNKYFENIIRHRSDVRHYYIVITIVAITILHVA